jgi:hypothetical protein
MRTGLRAARILIALTGTFVFFGTAATLPTYTCKMTKETMTIDGVLNEKTWGQADTLKFLENVGGGALVASRQTAHAFAAWDSTNLYVAYVTQDNDIKGVYKNHDDPLYNVEAVELFFDADGDGTTYIELEWNCYNASWDGLAGNPAGQNWTATGMVSAVKVRGTPDKSTDVDTGMTVEVKIPWKALDTNMTRKVALPPKNSDQMRINFYRIDQRTGIATQDLSAWSPTLTSTFHTPGRFGNIIFSTAIPTGIVKGGKNFFSNKADQNLPVKAVETLPGTMHISYFVPSQSEVRLTICNASGQRVRVFENGNQVFGPHETIWNCNDDQDNRLKNGMYTIFLQAGNFQKASCISIMR